MASLSPVMTPGELKNVLEAETHNNGLTQSGIFQCWLQGIIGTDMPFGMSNSAATLALQDAIIVGLDAEWYEHDASLITELGVCVLDPRTIPKPSSNNTTGPSPAWDILAALETHHVRIKPHAHLVNKDFCSGYPENFQFGSTTFASISTAQKMLRSIFLRQDEHASPRPVIFIGHAVDNDYEVLKQRFGIDVLSLGTIITTLDTQTMAIEQSLSPNNRQISLKNLLAHYGIQEQYLHNAGNDIVTTLITALLMAYPTPPTPTPTPTALSYANLKPLLTSFNTASSPHRPSYGQLRFCTKCDSELHTLRHCKVSMLHCDFCAADPKSAPQCHTHKTDKCGDAARTRATNKATAVAPKTQNAVPCQWCVQSTDPKRYKGREAYGHESAECPFLEQVV
ncbi:hypothetical protein BM1_05953 [Bipolaris maydis]|nr:hypothetical protein BM1_05953 [Bipolaris maydis]KAJ5028584.1 hypothetical protein J3E73DRAFT_367509 [Bipolaris maydis]KAJ6272756.1 hypothetical protein PSV08DRAFT_245550 [Bipolaris maydis]KAJ6279331.1 hypothetical protein J3E71DRAFT_345209 [Bipolaris maydis]